jgi:hypothetical protein
MMGQKKVEIFSREFRKSLAKQFLEVAYMHYYSAVCVILFICLVFL